MHIIIKEENGFMPDKIIKIYEDRIEVSENNKDKVLGYDKNRSRDILEMFLDIFKDWNNKYVSSGIIDDDIFVITIVSNKNKEIYIKNKYPSNWSKFILFRNRLLREEL